jgi:hypothetical protein
MALSFPSSPTLNQTYTVGSKTWNGYAWDLQATGFAIAPGQASIGVFLDTFTMDGTANTCTLATVPATANNIVVNINGIEQLSTAYTLDGNVVTLSETPINGTVINIRTFRTDTDVANSASLYANTAYDTATAASNTANSASDAATAAFIQANNAYTAANTKTSLGKSIAMTIVFGG